MPVLVILITSVSAAILGGVGTYVAARRDLQLKFDESLRDLRLYAYEKLWAKLERLAKYGRPQTLTKSAAQQLRDDLSRWYFDTGGLYLSTDARKDYFQLQDGLELVIARGPDPLSPSDDEYVRVLGSRLRSAMTRDVGTRRTYIFKGDSEPPTLGELYERLHKRDGGSRSRESHSPPKSAENRPIQPSTVARLSRGRSRRTDRDLLRLAQ